MFVFQWQEWNEYGIDPDAPCPAPESESIETQDVMCPLQDEDFEEMKRQIDPLNDTDGYGNETYIQACIFAASRSGCQEPIWIGFVIGRWFFRRKCKHMKVRPLQ